MSKFDHRFWEISVPHEQLANALHEQDIVTKLLDFVTEEEKDISEAQRADLINQIQAIISSKLTSQQQKILSLYYFQGKSQQEIATELGIAQQVVSKQLFGVVREGEKIGGAVKKIRKHCEKLGLSPIMGVKLSK